MEEQFIALSALLCEPTRAKMVWNLLDGRAYTASELAVVADVSATAASNHLTKLLEAKLLKVESQGRHRYYSFSRPEVAYAVESLAQLATGTIAVSKAHPVSGIHYCRTCYDHLAGWVGVTITEALESKGVIEKTDRAYRITVEGWHWLTDFGIVKDALVNKRRPLARQCLDWSERRPHLAGQLGAIMLETMLARDWFRKVRFSRELVVSAAGSQALGALLNVHL